jgi:predicted dehydrogenase
MKHRIGLVGLGEQAKRKYLPALREASQVELRAVCDVDEARCAAWGAELGVPAFAGHEAMLDRTPLDFIVVATPHDAHAGVVRAAAQRGVHVLKEKPFARDLGEALEMQRLCDKGGIQLMTALPRRFDRHYQQVLALRERIGSLFFAEIKYTKFVARPGDGWRGQKRRAGGGCILDMGYHMTDLILWYLSLPDLVHANLSQSATSDRDYDTEDTALVTFEYASGLYGSLTLSRFLPPETELVRLVGTQGIVEVTPKYARRLRSSGEVVESVAQDNLRPRTAELLDHFSAVLRGERENFAGPTDHLPHARLIAACYASHATGVPVDPRHVSIPEDSR